LELVDYDFEKKEKDTKKKDDSKKSDDKKTSKKEVDTSSNRRYNRVKGS